MRWKGGAWRQGEETHGGPSRTAGAGAGPRAARGASEGRAVGQGWGAAWWEPGDPVLVPQISSGRRGGWLWCGAATLLPPALALSPWS